jgi:hypothetical protein
MKLTGKQMNALLEARQKGKIFQLPESVRHAPALLSRLCKIGLLERKQVGVIWELTQAGKTALDEALGKKKPSVEG